MASCSPIFKGNKTSSSDNSENSLCLRGFNTFPASCFMEQLNFSGMITESGILSGITSREIHDGTIDKDSNNFVVTFDIYLQQRELSALLTSLNYKVVSFLR